MVFQNQSDGVVVRIKVQPRASKNRIAGILGDCLKVAVTAPPVDGEANSACIDFFSQLLKVPKSSIEIIGGHTSRTKLLKIYGVRAEQVKEKLEK